MFSRLHNALLEWTGFDSTTTGGVPAWLFSLTLHIALLVVISLMTFAAPARFELTLTIPDEVPAEQPEEFHFQDEFAEEIGAGSNDGVGIAMAAAPELAEFDDVLQPTYVDPLISADIRTADESVAATRLSQSTKLIRGVAGVGVTGAEGAIDRVTHEILLSLEDKDTLVVWLFDQSASLSRQRTEINERLARIYEELGLIRDDVGNPHSNRHPLLTSVVAFGAETIWKLDKPTADVQEIQAAVESIALDESGIENVFSSIFAAAKRFQKWRSRRNVMLIAITDEVGDDHHSMLAKCVQACRRNAMPVYVLGVPAAFGESETLLKWVDPNPKYSQAPQWGRVNQGPESLRPERLHLPFANAPRETMDSGFGPFALTRLCYQTGGIYFTIHPNRRVGRRIGRRETDPFSSHFAYFFDPQKMRPYRPEYVSLAEYDRRAQSNLARTAVLKAARLTINRMESPRTEFVKRDEAQFASALTESQKRAAKLEPKLNALHEILKNGIQDRANEESLRWQAAFDLAHGQTLAVLVRTRGYNEMLAQAKRGLTPKNQRSNTWRLVADSELSTSSRLERHAAHAEDYLQRVVTEHEGTPWALLAQRELEMPFGWRWEESYTPQPRDRDPDIPAANDGQRVPRDEQRRMLPDAPRRRDVPKL